MRGKNTPLVNLDQGRSKSTHLFFHWCLFLKSCMKGIRKTPEKKNQWKTHTHIISHLSVQLVVHFFFILTAFLECFRETP